MRHTPAPSRSVGIDVVRVIAIVAIVAGHAWTRDRSALVVYPWHVSTAVTKSPLVAM